MSADQYDANRARAKEIVRIHVFPYPSDLPKLSLEDAIAAALDEVYAEGRDQEKAMWELARLGQEIEEHK